MNEALDIQVIETTEEAKGIVVKDTDTYLFAAEKLKAAKALASEIKEFFKPLKEKAKAAHHALCESEKEKLAPLDVTISDIGGKMRAYEAEQARAAKEEERRLSELAKKQEEEARLLEAIEAEESGDADTAKRIMEEKLPAPVVRVQAEVPKVQGLSYRTSYHAEVTDLRALVKAVAAGEVPILAVMASQQFLDSQARSLKESFAYPGVSCKSERSITARR